LLSNAGRPRPAQRRSTDGRQRDQRDPPVGRAEEHGDRDDRQQLTDGPGGEEVGAEQAAQQVVLAQDGQQRAQSRRRERNGDRDERPDESDGVQQADDSTGQRRRHQP
jgi:hypothetical protein